MQQMGTAADFAATQFQIRHPAEHTIDGTQQDLEIQWLHKADPKDITNGD